MNRRRFLALLGGSAFAPTVAKDSIASEQVNAIDEVMRNLLMDALVPTPNIGTLTQDIVKSFSDFE